ncbi:MAG TPA: EAL domain-containing protein [Novosphingobium sp.]|nr:EAL domain-containing protein [Novosphingobium sp.]
MELNDLITTQSGPTGDRRLGRAERDIVALGIAVAAIIMFVGTGGSLMPQIARAWAGHGSGPDMLLINAVLLNIALVIFGWRRYRELADEIHERRKAETQARLLAETDPLTGCLNRRSIGPATDRLIAETHGRGEAVAFLMLDLDNFKQVNDLNGHSAGDAILKESALRMLALLPEHSLLARLGGDEFACVVPFNPRYPERIDQLAVAIIEQVARPTPAGGHVIEVTVSVGVTRSDLRDIANVGPVDAQMLLHMADIAMYQAKKHGRNRYYWFEPSMENELRFRSELEAGIRAGIGLGEFVPFYEQQIDIQTGEVVGFEMLARWNSPKLGIVNPDVFIPVAEEIGIIAELSEGLIAQALQDAKAWDPKLTLSVNISPVQLRDPWFAQKLLKLLVEANFPPSRLDIEITESSLIDNLGVVRTLITSLKNQGIGISLDDFGTGYSSLAQLRSLPFDRIKIDRSFITNLPGNKDSATIVETITALADGLGMPITAEGIETAEVLKELKQLGQYQGQGYLYGHPETAALTHERLAKLDRLSEPQPGAEPDGIDDSEAESRTSSG